MKIQFDGAQEYQQDAIAAVVDLFSGLPLAQGKFEMNLRAASELTDELGRGNLLTLSEEALLTNVQEVQQRNGIAPVEKLDGRNFSVEMETGTGKTYVYLRTIYDLFTRYGLSKFVIVVPSIAIREGVLTSIRLMKEHFAALYDNTPMEAQVYDSKQVSRLRGFATANTLQVLILNIQAFDKASTIMQKDNDRMSGRRPIDFIQATCPIVIMDEPQNMESPTAKKAIASLNPLCTLRYSATHKNRYNLVYRLGPVKAYDLNLVKKIVVNSVVEEGDFNRPFIALESITATKTKVTARLKLDVQGANGPVRKVVTVKGNESLVELSEGREVYAGYVLEEIDAGNGFVRFTNGIRIDTGEGQGSDRDAVMRAQVKEAIKEHFEKELKIHRLLPEGKRLKVLSLFFIDRVANYAPAEGKIRRWFEECYQELAARPDYQRLKPLPVATVHDGYFAEEKGMAKDSQEGRDTQADDSAYRKIMQEKEKLLSMEEPLRFIFSHSALREGWDNPNVFQICTLNETRSEMKKRQEIGRGLRLPVDETGIRVFDPNINRLTVIANESYNDFAKQLQNEIKEDTGEEFKGRIENKRDRRKANLIPGWTQHVDFVALWERIQAKTRYAVEYKTEDLIAKAAEYVYKMGPVAEPSILIQQRLVEMTEAGITGRLLRAREERDSYKTAALPDIIGYLQRETHLTRHTLVEILKRSGRLGEAPKNPQAFLDKAVRAIKVARQEIMVTGIKYERLEGEDAAWDMMLFEDKEIEGFADRMLDATKCIYDAIEIDSETERKFAAAFETRDDIKFYLKLPPWFKIQTPLGTYNPDWAIVKQEAESEPKLYLVRETKSSLRQFDLRNSEEMKIVCGHAHFEALQNGIYDKACDPLQV